MSKDENSKDQEMESIGISESKVTLEYLKEKAVERKTDDTDLTGYLLENGYFYVYYAANSQFHKELKIRCWTVPDESILTLYGNVKVKPGIPALVAKNVRKIMSLEFSTFIVKLEDGTESSLDDQTGEGNPFVDQTDRKRYAYVFKTKEWIPEHQ